MALKAVFVGISKHADPEVPELNGAHRDALALWALFSDTYSDLKARLLVNEDATHASVGSSIDDVLSNASDEDVIIISFAGHGAPDGSLVLHDTVARNLSETALSMTSLADAFKQTKARAVLMILDCCFSGQAPARVLEVDAQARSAFVLQDIYGEGRIILSACAGDEAAWEQPGTGHGLLTYAIIKAMTDTAADEVQFPDVAGEIIRWARDEGSRIGVVQTPVFLGEVKGGLTFPVLLKGNNYHVSFPQTKVPRITGAFEEFESFGFPREIVGQWTSNFPNGLNRLQTDAINNYGILNGEDALVVAPTSSGKTLIGEVAAIQAVASGRKAAFLLPYRALVNEKFHDFSERYEDAGLRVVRCSGDASDGIGPALAGRYDLGFFTYETFLNMALASPRLLNQLGLIVVDEGQFITDPRRGISVELIFAMLRRARENGVNPQLVVLSAVIGKLNGFDEWLDLPVLSSSERPVPLIEGVLDRDGIFQSLGVDGSSSTEQLLGRHQVIQRGKKPSSQDVIVPLAKKLIGENEKLLIFRNVRGPAQGCAAYLARELGLPPAQAAIEDLPSQDLSRVSSKLLECLQGGTAFHNTNLLRAERELIESCYRDPEGGIHALAATTTLAAGINTPASTVILAENEFVGADGRPFTIAEYKNMAGRAGRLGYNETGKAIILADNGMERAQLFQKYVLGKPEDVTSSFKRKDLPTWILRLLSQVKGVNREEVFNLLTNTFGGYLSARDNPSWADLLKIDVDEFVTRLIDVGFAETEGNLLHLTMLGRACGASSLSFESSVRLIELLRPLDASSSSAHHVLAIIQVLDEMDDVYTPIMKRGRSESVRSSEMADRYDRATMRLMQRYVRDEHDFIRRCKRASILFDWIHGEEVEEIERRYSTTPFQGTVSYGDIIRIADAARFHLRSALQIVSSIMPEQSSFLEQVDKILVRIELGLPDDAIPLVAPDLPIVRGQYLALFAAGARTISEVAALQDALLFDILGETLTHAYRTRNRETAAP